MKRELPKESLASIDEQGGHLKLYPAAVKGVFQVWRGRVQFVLVFIFLILPWTKINGRQSLLLDVVDREFSIFGLSFWAHDGPMSFFILALATLSLALFTALLGRVWCGWACPQTVFLDGVYRRIESWIEGNHIQRRRLDEGPMTSKKFWKKFFKWAIFLFLTLNITHSFLAYFVGAEELLAMSLSPPSENPASFIFIVLTTGVLLFNFAVFREQFCVIVCPYGRFQSVLLDENSLTISYDEKRGEPRKAPGVPPEKQGDCINCYKCVAVCPTGVDIRRGLQMECIQCTACIDICDEVMEKINKPKGLIRYTSTNGLKGLPTKIFRSRVVIYIGLITLILASFIWALNSRSQLDITLLRAGDAPYQILNNQEQTVINHFKLNLKNQSLNTHEIEIQMANTATEQKVILVAPQKQFLIEAGELKRQHIFVKFPKGLTARNGYAEVHLNFKNGKNIETMIPIKIIGPVAGAQEAVGQ